MPALDGLTLAWLALAILAAIVEVSIPHFGVIFVTLAAIVAAAVAFFGVGGAVQVMTFAIVLVASLAVLRPRLVKRLGTAPGIPSRTQALIGREGLVTADIDPTIGSGRVNVGGQDWAARSRMPVAAGVRVLVVGADGIVLEVTPL